MRWHLLFRLIPILLVPATGWASEVPPHVESLVIPFAKRYPNGPAVYARNTWDLQAFGGQLYIGAGNWSNRGPAPNAGPVPILAWDPAEEAIVREGEVDDEEISRFEVIDDRLFIPGVDPRESWKLGNLYRRETDGRWRKMRTIPRAIHAYALAGHAGRLYAGLKATDTVPWYVDWKGYGSAVAFSRDGGGSWGLLPLGGHSIQSFLRVANQLYATDLFPSPGLERWISEHDREKYYAPVYALDSSCERFVRRSDLTFRRLFPDTEEARGGARVISRTVPFGESVLYIGSSVHGPFGLYRADSLAVEDIRTSRIRLPEGTFPRDILVREGVVFVLLQGPATRKGIQIRVLALRSLKPPVGILSFAAPTFARSFELLNGDFYFGLGCEVQNVSEWRQEELHPETGRLLRIKGDHLPALRTVLEDDVTIRFASVPEAP